MEHKMKLLICSTPRCGNHYYTISIYDGERSPLNKQVTDFSDLISGETEDVPQETFDLDLVIEKMKDMGDDPDYSDSREIYDSLYDGYVRKRNPLYQSRYINEIETIIQPINNCYKIYSEREHDQNFLNTFGYFEYKVSDQRQRGMIFQTSGSLHSLTPGMKLYVTKISNGQGCMTTTIPIAIFTDLHECNNFEQKVEDMLKSYESGTDNSSGWNACLKETYELNNDLKTFRGNMCSR